MVDLAPDLLLAWRRRRASEDDSPEDEPLSFLDSSAVRSTVFVEVSLALGLRSWSVEEEPSLELEPALPELEELEEL